MSKLAFFLVVSVVLLFALNSFVIVAMSSSSDDKSYNDLNLALSSSPVLVSDDFDDESDDLSEDLPITGNALERASAVALNHIGSGRVTDSEIGDEEGYYEIEITLDNGNEVDVHLSENFNVLSTEYEDE